MAKLTSPLLSLEASNQLGQAIIFGSRKGKNIACAYTIPRKKKTHSQQQHRRRYQNYIDEWHNLYQARKDAYTTQAEAQKRISGYHQFLHEFLQPQYKGQLYLDPRVIALWHFNEGEGTTLYDASRYHNDGTIHGATWSTGKFGPALNFNGVDNYVNCGSTNTIDLGTNNFTLNAWIKTPPTGTWQAISWKSYLPGYNWMIGPTGHIRLEIAVTAILDGYSNTIVTDNDWHMVTVAATRDGTAVFYLDGIPDGSFNISSQQGNLSNTYNLEIGFSSPWTAYPFTGLIDEVRISNRALSPEEIKQNYNLSL